MPETAVMDSMFSIFNLGSASQAGRRGFESRLPLHLFNNLGVPIQSTCSKMLQLVHSNGSLEPVNRLTATLQ